MALEERDTPAIVLERDLHLHPFRPWKVSIVDSFAGQAGGDAQMWVSDEFGIEEGSKHLLLGDDQVQGLLFRFQGSDFRGGCLRPCNNHLVPADMNPKPKIPNPEH